MQNRIIWCKSYDGWPINSASKYALAFLFPAKAQYRHTQSTGEAREERFPYRQTQDQPWCLWTLPFITIVYHSAWVALSYAAPINECLSLQKEAVTTGLWNGINWTLQNMKFLIVRFFIWIVNFPVFTFIIYWIASSFPLVNFSLWFRVLIPVKNDT